MISVPFEHQSRFRKIFPGELTSDRQACRKGSWLAKCLLIRILKVFTYEPLKTSDSDMAWVNKKVQSALAAVDGLAALKPITALQVS